MTWIWFSPVFSHFLPFLHRYESDFPPMSLNWLVWEGSDVAGSQKQGAQSASASWSVHKLLAAPVLRTPSCHCRRNTRPLCCKSSSAQWHFCNTSVHGMSSSSWMQKAPETSRLTSRMFEMLKHSGNSCSPYYSTRCWHGNAVRFRMRRTFPYTGFHRSSSRKCWVD